MSHHRRHVQLGLAILVSACSQDRTTAPSSSSLRVSTPPSQVTLRAGPADLDEEWAQLARVAIPGFAGMYRENEGYVVAVSRADQRTRALAHLRTQLGARGARFAAVRARVVRWSFAELKPWKDAITPLLDDQDVYWVDVDERRNMIVLGIREPGIRASLARALVDRGVPPDAIDYQVVSKPVARTDVTGNIRPVVGGLQINSSAGICTLGVNAYRNGNVNGFVTASHCSSSQFSTDGTAQHQPSATNQIGTETYDPGGTRTADASFYTYGTGVTRDWGHIARTTSYGVNQDGSKTIDGSYPKFRITSKASNSVQLYGEVVNKVGRTSGWTRGQVTQTCVTKAGLSCQWVAAVWSWQGDSGAPMFQQDGSSEPDASRVGFWGILWGGPANDSSETWYSTIASVEQDLGTLDIVCAASASTCAPPPPYVYITGLSEIQAYTVCSWDAIVSNGTYPYSYQWKLDNVNVGINSATYTTSSAPASNFTLDVYITDALGALGSATFPVTVNGSGQIVCE